MQVWWLFTIETFDFFEYMQVLCTFGTNMLIFFEYMQVWCVLSKYYIFCFSCRFWKGISHKTCRGYAILKWTKLKLKTESGFDVLKTSNHQNKFNRVCIKHWNLQCFLSISFNVFNATLGSDTFPHPEVGPGGGATIYIYIFFNLS